MNKHDLRLKRHKHGAAKLWLIVVAVLMLFLVSSVIVIRNVYNRNLKPISSSQKIVIVTIPSGASVSQISKKLQDQGVIRASWAFEWYVRNKNFRESLQAGTYSLRQNQSVAEIVSILTNGKVATNLLTILPGQRLDQIKKTFVNSGYSVAEVDKAFDPALYANHPALVDKPAGASLEGYLYPDSFQKISETAPETIIRASLDEMQKALTPDVRAGIFKQGISLQDGITLASIVEQEVSNPNDKPTVAQVFYKRLSMGMPLASDVTAIYGAIVDGVSLPDNPAQYAAKAIAFDSPYNTYIHAGLPPGPISNVSVASLKAVAHPSPTDYLYFVAGDDGITHFSRTFEEHQALINQHCKKNCG